MTTVRRILALVVVCPAALPAAAQAERPPDADALGAVGLRVTWPVNDAVPAYYAGERLVVRVTAARDAPNASVSLVRVDARGGTMRVISRRSVGGGTAHFSVPTAGGRYRLRLDVAGERYFSSFTARRARPATKRCPDGRRAAADVALSRASGAPGDVLRVELRNTGRACLTGERDHHWERRLPDGTWEIVPGHGGTHDAPDVVTTPGQTTSYTTVVRPDLQPGPYRVVTKVTSDDGPLVLGVPFEVEAPAQPSARSGGPRGGWSRPLRAPPRSAS